MVIRMIKRSLKKREKIFLKSRQLVRLATLLRKFNDMPEVFMEFEFVFLYYAIEGNEPVHKHA